MKLKLILLLFATLTLIQPTIASSGYKTGVTPYDNHIVTTYPNDNSTFTKTRKHEIEWVNNYKQNETHSHYVKVRESARSICGGFSSLRCSFRFAPSAASNPNLNLPPSNSSTRFYPSPYPPPSAHRMAPSYSVRSTRSDRRIRHRHRLVQLGSPYLYGIRFRLVHPH